MAQAMNPKKCGKPLNGDNTGLSGGGDTQILVSQVGKLEDFGAGKYRFFRYRFKPHE